MRRKIIYPLGIAVCILLSSFSRNAGALERFDLVTTEQLEQLLVKRKAGEVDFILVNTLDEMIFRDEAIPGSINLPWSRIDNRYQELGPDKNALIITYCMGYR